MKTVEQFLQNKLQEVWSVTPDDFAYAAIKLMAAKNIGALVVLDAGKLVGIISERDYLRRVLLKNNTSKDIPVREIMSHPVICVHPKQTIEECMAVITTKRIRHLPVVKDDQVLGIISIGDVLKSLLSEKDFIIEQLTEYMTVGY